MGDPVPERIALTEAAFRDLNARLVDHDEQAGYAAITMDFVCECYDATCHRHIPLTAVDWLAIHEDPRAFVIAPAHASAPWIEQVVERREPYWVVRKVGDAGRTSEEARPR
jgi:hypothetical protein